MASRTILNAAVTLTGALLCILSAEARSYQSPDARTHAAAIPGLDHIPIAVTDLEQASADYRALGFALKPGRLHDNGIRNQHIKFTDGTELELITAAEARDPLTTTYRRHLANGDGPAFLAFFAPSREAAWKQLDAARIPHGTSDLTGTLDYIFLAGRNASPTDRPEHFAHANTAESFISVWLAGADLSAERAFLTAAGATISTQKLRAPDTVEATVAALPEGTVLLLPEARQIVRGRRIVGATLRVRNLDAAQQAIRNGVPTAKITRHDRSVFLPPSMTHGLWIELREEMKSR